MEFINLYKSNSRHKYFITIDPGIIKIGCCIRDVNSYDIVYSDVSSLLEPKDGKVYKYEECSMVFLMEQWLRDRWVYFSQSVLVVIEKQMTRLLSNIERACILFETSLKSMLTVLQCQYGNPFVHVIRPADWRKAAGVITDGQKRPNIPSRVVNGKFKLSTVNLDRSDRKLESGQRFQYLKDSNNKDYQRLMKCVGDRVITIDEQEAYLMNYGLFGTMSAIINKCMQTPKIIFEKSSLVKHDKSVSIRVPGPFGQPPLLEYISIATRPTKKQKVPHGEL
jgi:hypothetical protein